jgi:hypothetical protein
MSGQIMRFKEKRTTREAVSILLIAGDSLVEILKAAGFYLFYGILITIGDTHNETEDAVTLGLRFCEARANLSDHLLKSHGKSKGILAISKYDNTTLHTIGHQDQKPPLLSRCSNTHLH